MLRIKHLCHSCQTKFYNLSNSEITCPACGVTISEINLNIREKDVPINEEEIYSDTENSDFLDNNKEEDKDELYILNKDYNY